jgi:nucleotide-binding universal stress UspA family protein
MGYLVGMTRVMMAVDGSELDEPLAITAYRLFGDDAQYWAVNVRHQPVGAGPAPISAFPATYGGSFIGFGTAYPFLPPDPYDVRVAAVHADSDPAVDRVTAPPPETPEQADVPDTADLAAAGDPPDAIMRAAHVNEADVIVVGDHDRSWWSKLIDPAVGDELIDRSDIPVLVVRCDATQSTADSGDAGP